VSEATTPRTATAVMMRPMFNSPGSDSLEALSEELFKNDPR
jgi:hypothetical protein